MAGAGGAGADRALNGAAPWPSYVRAGPGDLGPPRTDGGWDAAAAARVVGAAESASAAAWPAAADAFLADNLDVSENRFMRSASEVAMSDDEEGAPVAPASLSGAASDAGGEASSARGDGGCPDSAGRSEEKKRAKRPRALTEIVTAFTDAHTQPQVLREQGVMLAAGVPLKRHRAAPVRFAEDGSPDRPLDAGSAAGSPSGSVSWSVPRGEKAAARSLSPPLASGVRTSWRARTAPDRLGGSPLAAKGEAARVSVATLGSYSARRDPDGTPSGSLHSGVMVSPPRRQQQSGAGASGPADARGDPAIRRRVVRPGEAPPMTAAHAHAAAARSATVAHVHGRGAAHKGRVLGTVGASAKAKVLLSPAPNEIENWKQFTCKRGCRLQFSNEIRLRAHLARAHCRADEYFLCTVCSCAFLGEKSRDGHVHFHRADNRRVAAGSAGNLVAAGVKGLASKSALAISGGSRRGVTGGASTGKSAFVLSAKDQRSLGGSTFHLGKLSRKEPSARVMLTRPRNRVLAMKGVDTRRSSASGLVHCSLNPASRRHFGGEAWAVGDVLWTHADRTFVVNAGSMAARAAKTDAVDGVVQRDEGGVEMPAADSHLVDFVASSFTAALSVLPMMEGEDTFASSDAVFGPDTASRASLAAVSPMLASDDNSVSRGGSELDADGGAGAGVDSSACAVLAACCAELVRAAHFRAVEEDAVHRHAPVGVRDDASALRTVDDDAVPGMARITEIVRNTVRKLVGVGVASAASRGRKRKAATHGRESPAAPSPDVPLSDVDSDVEAVIVPSLRKRDRCVGA